MTFLGCEAIDPPRLARAGVTKTIMQTIRTALPEFDTLRFDPITAPVWWTRNFLPGESFLYL